MSFGASSTTRRARENPLSLPKRGSLLRALLRKSSFLKATSMTTPGCCLTIGWSGRDYPSPIHLRPDRSTSSLDGNASGTAQCFNGDRRAGVGVDHRRRAPQRVLSPLACTRHTGRRRNGLRYLHSIRVSCAVLLRLRIHCPPLDQIALPLGMAATADRRRLCGRDHSHAKNS